MMFSARPALALTLGTAGWLIATGAPPLAAQARARGTIEGHVRLTGSAPANSIIRMGADPLCAAAARARGGRPVQETVLRAADGGLANAFVEVRGSFPAEPVPATAVTIDQKGCIYTPRVLGVRTGQTLLIKNNDRNVHNVHGVSTKANDFNMSQPSAGMVSRVVLKNAEEMLRVKCDLHSWMVAFVGVVSHPYFAVSDVSGAFRITNVPAGSYTIHAWHERYGPVSQKVLVKPGAPARVEFAYSGSEKPPTARLGDLTILSE